MAGHELDANTLALWRMNHSGKGSKLMIVDSGAAGINMTATTEALSALPRPVGPFNKFVRSFNVSRHDGPADGDASSRALLIGDHTAEAYIYITSHAAIKTILAYSATGTSAATNYLIRWTIALTTGRQALFWESGTNVARNNAQALGSGVPLNTWAHVAYVKTAATTFYYLNGVLQDSVATGVVASGGTLSEWNLGTTEANTNRFSGDMAHVRLTARALSAPELLANAALINTTFDPPTADAWIHWKMTETADTVMDESTHLVHLWPTETAKSIVRNAPLVQDDGHSIFVNATNFSGYAANSTTTSASGIELIRQSFENQFTFEGWYKSAELPHQIDQRGLFTFGDVAVEAESSNFLSVYINSDSSIGWNSEYGPSTDHSIRTTTYKLPDRNARYHFAIRRNPTVAGEHTVDIFVNGALVETFTGIFPYTGGTTQTLYLCGGPAGTTATNFYGTVDDVRISNVARTDSEIYQDYMYGIGENAVLLGGDYTISGTWSNYTGTGEGIQVNVYETVRNVWVGEATTVSGGHYSVNVESPTKQYFAVARQDSTHLGRTDDGYPE